MIHIKFIIIRDATKWEAKSLWPAIRVTIIWTLPRKKSNHRFNWNEISNKVLRKLIKYKSILTFVTHPMISCENVCCAIVLEIIFQEKIHTLGNMVDNLHIIEIDG